METIGSNGPVSSDAPSDGTGWLIITFWATYFSMVFGVLYVLI